MERCHRARADGLSYVPGGRRALASGQSRRMLLTSAGIRNEVLRSALAGLVGRPFGRAAVAVIPTASAAAPGDHGWLIENLNRLHGLGWREFNVVELNGLPGRMVLERLRRADVIYVEGGNPYYLAHSIIANGLAEEMAAVIESKVYVGVSAGSMIFSRNLSAQTAKAFAEHDDLRILGEAPARSPFGLFDWYVMPHLNSPSLPYGTLRWFDKAVSKLDFPVYALDDDSAVRVRGGEVDVVSGGQWRLLNPPGHGSEPVGPARHDQVSVGVLAGITAVAWSVVLSWPRGRQVLASAQRWIQARR
jgi:dipeptidase E